MQVLVEEVDEEGAVARSAADAPEIDGLVYIDNGQDLKVGDFCQCAYHGFRYSRPVGGVGLRDWGQVILR